MEHLRVDAPRQRLDLRDIDPQLNHAIPDMRRHRDESIDPQGDEPHEQPSVSGSWVDKDVGPDGARDAGDPGRGGEEQGSRREIVSMDDVGLEPPGHGRELEDPCPVVREREAGGPGANLEQGNRPRPDEIVGRRHANLMPLGQLIVDDPRRVNRVGFDDVQNPHEDLAAFSARYAEVFRATDDQERSRSTKSRPVRPISRTSSGEPIRRAIAAARVPGSPGGTRIPVPRVLTMSSPGTSNATTGRPQLRYSNNLRGEISRERTRSGRSPKSEAAMWKGTSVWGTSPANRTVRAGRSAFARASNEPRAGPSPTTRSSNIGTVSRRTRVAWRRLSKSRHSTRLPTNTARGLSDSSSSRRHADCFAIGWSRVVLTALPTTRTRRGSTPCRATRSSLIPSLTTMNPSTRRNRAPRRRSLRRPLTVRPSARPWKWSSSLRIPLISMTSGILRRVLTAKPIFGVERRSYTMSIADRFAMANVSRTTRRFEPPTTRRTISDRRVGEWPLAAPTTNVIACPIDASPFASSIAWTVSPLWRSRLMSRARKRMRIRMRR